MKHVCINTPGVFIGLESKRLLIKEKDTLIFELPLNRIKTLQILSKGISISSNVLYELSARGVSVFFLDYRKIPVMALSGTQNHSIVELRKKQFSFLESTNLIHLCKIIITAKIKNQRSVLLYFLKSKGNSFECSQSLRKGILSIDKIISESKNCDYENLNNWKEVLMGYEGASAHSYWTSLRESEYLPSVFLKRVGRGAGDIVNQSLNLGYSILMSYVWNSILKSGLEPYQGFLHENRPGRPALILDIMEEYRPWVVDRNIIKLRSILSKKDTFDTNIKNKIIEEIHKTFEKKFNFYGKQLKLETILQRQVYRLCGYIYEKKKYKPMLFKW